MIKLYYFFLNLIKNFLKVFYFFLPMLKKRKTVLIDNHVIFRRIDEYVTYILPSLRIPTKRIIFKDMLKIKFVVWKDLMNKMIKDFDRQTFVTSEDFYLFVKDFFKDANNNTKIKWLEIGIPLEAIQKFEEWQNQRADSVSELIKNVAHSSIYSTYEEKLSVILDCLSLGLSLTVIDAEKTIKNLNGDLDPILKVYNKTKGHSW